MPSTTPTSSCVPCCSPEPRATSCAAPGGRLAALYDGAMGLQAKFDRLLELLRAMPAAVVAYSGGVDSSLLMHAAHSVLGERAVAVTAVSASLARRELAAAKQLARTRGWRHRLVATNELGRAAYVRNGADRCYHCKAELMDVLVPVAGALGAEVLLGTNTDDLGDHRPGIAAAAERGARSPLVEAGLSKGEVRALARLAGLPTADKPAAPCLASRLAYGVPVTPAGLRRIEAAEEVVRSYGFEVLRVRDLGGRARVEVEPARVPEAQALAGELAAKLGALGFSEVTVDERGFRSGALNELLLQPRLRAARSDR